MKDSRTRRAPVDEPLKWIARLYLALALSQSLPRVFGTWALAWFSSGPAALAFVAPPALLALFLRVAVLPPALLYPFAIAPAT